MNNENGIPAIDRDKQKSADSICTLKFIIMSFSFEVIDLIYNIQFLQFSINK